jgi:predicted nucleic acid-binding protein
MPRSQPVESLSEHATSSLSERFVTYFLDTNAIGALMRADKQMEAWLSSIASSDRVVTCTIARGEILFGLERLAQGRRRIELEARAQKVFAALP